MRGLTRPERSTAAVLRIATAREPRSPVPGGGQVDRVAPHDRLARRMLGGMADPGPDERVGQGGRRGVGCGEGDGQPAQRSVVVARHDEVTGGGRGERARRRPPGGRAAGEHVGAAACRAHRGAERRRTGPALGAEAPAHRGVVDQLGQVDGQPRLAGGGAREQVVGDAPAQLAFALGSRRAQKGADRAAHEVVHGQAVADRLADRLAAQPSVGGAPVAAGSTSASIAAVVTRAIAATAVTSACSSCSCVPTSRLIEQVDELGALGRSRGRPSRPRGGRPRWPASARAADPTTSARARWRGGVHRAARLHQRAALVGGQGRQGDGAGDVLPAAAVPLGDRRLATGDDHQRPGRKRGSRRRRSSPSSADRRS